MARVTAEQRVTVQNNAETEIMRYAGDHYLWHKHVHNVELDAMQILKMQEMDQFDKTVDFSSRRTGKTACKELYLVEHNATHGDQEVGVVAPREAQAMVNIGYHTDAIRRSEILSGFIKYKQGRAQLNDGYYEFANNSKARAYGIMAQVDGGDLTCASLEEVDDMPADRLYSRFLLMLGASRRLGASKESINQPQIRITGVFKGADTLAAMVEGGKYHSLPVVDCYLGIELGILNENFIMDMRDELSPDEFIRQLLCRNVSARNLIWEKYIRKAIQTAVSARLTPEEPMPGMVYKKKGLLSFGYDAGGHGERPESSKHALTVTEQVGSHVVFIYAKTWSAGEDDMVVRKDLVSLWRYFRPDYAIGDAYGVGVISAVNDDLYQEGLISINRQAVGDGQSTQTTWPDWSFSPMRFEGMTKHLMAQALRSIFHRNRAAIAYVDDDDCVAEKDQYGCAKDMATLIRQLANIKPLPTSNAYSSYQMVKRDVGDDLFDAAMAGVWALATQGTATIPTVITNRTQTREQLLGGAGLFLSGGLNGTY